MPKANHVTSTSYNNGSIGNDQYAQGSEAITTCKSPFLPSTTPVSSVCLVNGHWSETVCHKPVVNRLEENEPSELRTDYIL